MKIVPTYHPTTILMREDIRNALRVWCRRTGITYKNAINEACLLWIKEKENESTDAHKG